MGSKKSPTSTTTTTLPEYYDNAAQGAVSLGQKIASRTYTPFEQQRVADLTPEEQQASQMARDTGQSQDLYAQAGKKLGDIQTFDKADLSKYENPYTDAALDPAVRETNLAAQSQIDQRKHQAMAQGSFGGSRETLGETAMQRQQLGAISDIESKGHAEAFSNAVKGWTADQGNQIKAASALDSVGRQIQEGRTQQIQDLMSVGGTKRAISQADLDFNYKQFTENRDWDVHNMGPLLTSLRVPHSSTTKTVTKSSSGIFGQVLGLVGTVVGAIYGGPAGAAAGGALGSALGGAVDG